MEEGRIVGAYCFLKFTYTLIEKMSRILICVEDKFNVRNYSDPEHFWYGKVVKLLLDSAFYV